MLEGSSMLLYAGAMEHSQQAYNTMIDGQDIHLQSVYNVSQQRRCHVVSHWAGSPLAHEHLYIIHPLHVRSLLQQSTLTYQQSQLHVLTNRL